MQIPFAHAPEMAGSLLPVEILFAAIARGTSPAAECLASDVTNFYLVYWLPTFTSISCSDYLSAR